MFFLADMEVLQGYEATSALLESLGHDVVDIASPFPKDVFSYFEILWSSLTAAIEFEDEQFAQLRPLTMWLYEKGQSVTGAQLSRTVSRLRTIAREAIVQMSDVDVVLTPTLAQLPPTIGAIRNDEDPAADFQAQCEFTPFTSPFNMTGQPAVSLPLHWTSTGIPVGMQFIGRPFDEVTLISLAAQLEQAQPWRDRHPAMW